MAQKTEQPKDLTPPHHRTEPRLTLDPARRLPRLNQSGRSTRAIAKQRDDESALTERSMAEIAAAADAVWQSNRR